MLKSLIGVGLLACGIAGAATVTYTTSGSFSAAGGSCAISSNAGTNNVLTCNNGQISFTNIPGNALVTPVGVDLGTFSVVAPNPDTSGLGFTPIAQFTMSISQTLPTVGGPTSFGNGTLSGTVYSNSGLLSIVFASPTVIDIGVVRYSLRNLEVGNTLDLNGPSTGNGTTPLSARITDTTVPEPSTFALLGLGLLGVGFFRRKQ
jgi:hypothetical protein